MRITGLAAALTLGVLALAVPSGGDVSGVALADYQYVPEPAATLERATDVVADDAHGQVFVAQAGAGLLVTDVNGEPLETIDMPGRQQALTLSEGGSTLYLLAWTGFGSGATGPALLGVDTVSHEVTTVADGRFQGCVIDQLAEAAGLLWVTNTCGSEGSEDFGYIDPVDGSAVKLPWPVVGGVSTVGKLLRVNGDSPRLAMTYDSSTAVLDISVGDTVTTTVAASSGYGGLMDVSPDGSQMVVSDGLNTYRLATDDLSVLARFNRPAYPSALAIEDDGTFAIGYVGKPDVVVYRTDSSRPFRTYEFPARFSSNKGVGHEGLAWGEDNLYAIADGRSFYAFTPRQAAHVRLELDRRHARYGEDLPVTVGLTPGATGRDVEIWSVDRFDERHLVKQMTVPRSGELKTTLRLARNGHLEVAYAGDDHFEPSFDPTPNVYVSAKVASVMRSGRLVRGVRVHHPTSPR